MEKMMKLKIVKDTVVNSILTEIKDKLNQSVSEKKKIEELLDLTKLKVVLILNSMNEDELVPKKDFESEEDFKNHILSVIEKIRDKLFSEMKSTFDDV